MPRRSGLKRSPGSITKSQRAGVRSPKERGAFAEPRGLAENIFDALGQRLAVLARRKLSAFEAIVLLRIAASCSKTFAFAPRKKWRLRSSGSYATHADIRQEGTLARAAAQLGQPAR